ncbi:MAG: twin-arginine translocation signal domain-containing protein [Thermomicrobia bacterium]|nr:twin-arginine translocation signal domain-containing protein [Thermomicrobia bacterium]
MISRRQALKISAVAVASAALAACGAPQQQPSSLSAIAPRQNSAASKADGRILFAKVRIADNGGKDDGLYVLDNTKVRKILSKAAGDDALEYPRWSPDGKQIAFVRSGDQGIFSDLWIMGADTANPRRITDFQSKIPHKNDVNAEKDYVSDSSVVAGVSWSQGGNFITFASDKGYRAMRPWSLDNPDQPPTIPQNLHLIGATAGFTPANSVINFHIDNTALAPDGKAMAFVGLWAQPDDFSNRQTQLYMLDFGTKKYPQLTDVPMFKWGAYDPGAQFNIYVMDVTPPAPGAPFTAANFSKPEKLTDETGIDARSGLSWTT